MVYALNGDLGQWERMLEEPVYNVVGEITLSDNRGGVVCDECGGQVNEWKHTYRKDLAGALTVVGSVCLGCDKND